MPIEVSADIVTLTNADNGEQCRGLSVIVAHVSDDEATKIGLAIHDVILEAVKQTYRDRGMDPSIVYDGYTPPERNKKCQ